jgi:membrane-associated phospholipid phosphatase
MCNCNPSRPCLGILITALLIFGLFATNLSQTINAELQSYTVNRNILSDNNSLSQWKPSSATISSPSNFLEAVRQNSNSSGNNNTVVSWNQLMTTLGLQKKIPAPYLARDYALMHVAIYDALLQPTNKNNNNNNNEKQAEVVVAIVASAAAEVLAYFFPENSTSIASLEEQQTTHIQGHDTLQIIEGMMFGHDVGKKVIAYAMTDNSSDAKGNKTPPSGPGKWTGTNPIGPLFGYHKTYILSSVAEFQPPPPYPFGSAKDLAEVQVVIDAAKSRTPEQIEIVHKWADLPPPTIWNSMLNDRIESQNLTIYESARASAYLNTAMYDSFVSCWYTKFTYWTARPIQRIISDPTFTTVIPTPNFPSYTSGHSTISSTASLILGQLFPHESVYFLSEAHEAAMSRLWAGIHFPQDNNNGIAIGQQIGKKYVNDMLKPSHPFVVPVGEVLTAPFSWKNNNN